MSGIDLLLKERIGYGTIIDALLTGNIVQMFNAINSMPENDSLWICSDLPFAKIVDLPVQWIIL